LEALREQGFWGKWKLIDFNEMISAGLLSENYIENLIRGFYPALYDRDIPLDVFYSNYVQTYIQRDVSELIAIRDIRLFQNFLSLCATWSKSKQLKR
jgi:predicted AAA+ superfamily ATPase